MGISNIVILYEYTCQHCQKKGVVLHAHHITRRPMGFSAPWECSEESLVTLCELCHEHETFYGKDALSYLLKTNYIEVADNPIRSLFFKVWKDMLYSISATIIWTLPSLCRTSMAMESWSSCGTEFLQAAHVRDYGVQTYREFVARQKEIDTDLSVPSLTDILVAIAARYYINFDEERCVTIELANPNGDNVYDIYIKSGVLIRSEHYESKPIPEGLSNAEVGKWIIDEISNKEGAEVLLLIASVLQKYDGHFQEYDAPLEIKFFEHSFKLGHVDLPADFVPYTDLPEGIQILITQK